MTGDDVAGVAQTARPTGLSRRGVVAAAAWSVPVIAVASASPAHATSADSTLTISVVQDYVAPNATSQVTVTVLDSQGRPWAGQPVSLTATQASGISFLVASGTTNAAGELATVMSVATGTASGPVTVTVTSDGYTAQDTFIVTMTNVVGVGANGNGTLGTGTTAGTTTAISSYASFPSPVAQISDGLAHTLYLLEDGTVWAVGSGQNGRLGTGGTGGAVRAVPVPGLTGVQQVAAGFGSSYALLADGTVMAWGLNNLGQLGDGTTADRTSPVAVLGVGGTGVLSGVSQISGGGSGAFALVGDEVRAWGGNADGQLGDGTTTARATPVAVLGVGGTGVLSGISSIDAGNRSTYAVTTTGEVRAWGANTSGGLGIGTASVSNATTPAVVVTAADGTIPLTGITAVSGSDVSALALTTAGTVMAWGWNAAGALGDGTTTSSTFPVQVGGVGGTGVLGGVVEISSQYQASYARLADGSILSWGSNSSGQLSTGSTSNRSYPGAFTLPAGELATGLADGGFSGANFINVVLTP